MNRDLRLYVEDIWESITAIEEYTRGVSKAEFEDDRQLQDAVARRLETIGEAVKHLPDASGILRCRGSRLPACAMCSSTSTST